jgi:hypothetical protein
MYARKVCLLQGIKYVPKSIELISAMTADSEADRGRTIEMNKSGDVISITGGEPEQEERQAQIEAPVVEEVPVRQEPAAALRAQPVTGSPRNEQAGQVVDAQQQSLSSNTAAPITKVGNRSVNTLTGEVLD